MKKIVPLVLILAASAGAGWYFYSRYSEAHQPLQLYGNVDIREVDLGFRVAGRIAEVLHDEGDAVKAGELLARVDREPFEREVERAKAARSQAQAALAQAKAEAALKKAGYRSEEIDQSKATLAQNQVSMENARRTFKRQGELIASRSVSRQQYEDAEASFQEYEQRVKLAEANLALLEAGYRTEEVAAAEAAASAAEATVRETEAAVKAAEIQLADTELKSPSDGVVITRAQEPGAIVQAGPTVISLSLEKPVWVRAYVAEPDLGKFPPGTHVTLRTDSSAGKDFTGTVGFVSPRAEFTPKPVETEQLRTSLVYRLRITVDDSDGSMRQGMPVTISLSPTP
ncbi:MAG: HlyD family efflux transporter periplasmic adaptor subunit [Verrucomicrobiaceae bacterium]|nr:MAG: HlyD family efflux transporter periplasmic adaptor subunit [Verrucomicrobiaceae bacterium]